MPWSTSTLSLLTAAVAALHSVHLSTINIKVLGATLSYIMDDNAAATWRAVIPSAFIFSCHDKRGPVPVVLPGVLPEALTSSSLSWESWSSKKCMTTLKYLYKPYMRVRIPMYNRKIPLKLPQVQPRLRLQCKNFMCGHWYKVNSNKQNSRWEGVTRLRLCSTKPWCLTSPSSLLPNRSHGDKITSQAFQLWPECTSSIHLIHYLWVAGFVVAYN